MLQPDTPDDNTQGFRSVHKSQKPSTIAVVDPDDIIYIDCHTDPEDPRKVFILWEDIQQAFEGALFVRDSKAKMLPFIKGKDFTPLVPRRIVAVRGMVLDVVVGGELPAVDISMLQKTVQDLSITEPPQQTRSSTPRNPAYGLIEEAMQNYNHIELPAASHSTSQVPQAISSRDQHDGGRGNNASIKNQPASGTTSSQRRDGPQDCGTATSMGLMQTMISASQGDINAQVALGDRYRKGDGVNQDYQEAMDWYLKAAEQNNSQAQFMIGVLYFQHNGFEQFLHLNQGDGDSVRADSTIPKDNAKALEWFLKAAHQGLADAQFGVAITMQGMNPSPDPETIATVLDWYRKAANQNHGLAQAFLGGFYMKGLGVLKDESQALEWCLKAVGRSGGFVEYLLGDWHYGGYGVPQDKLIAFEWFLKSAEQGFDRGCYMVGKLYEEGAGVPKNREKAIEWYTKAYKAGDKDAKVELERLTSK
ncbi:hypothetical protein EC991_006413 [Linnemannia zychae]|nr:hypothetical protein EC991_006413 [Linnemannia zychae]